MGNAAMVREGLDHYDRWTMTLWLTAPGVGGGQPGKWQPSTMAGPMRGVVCCGDDPDRFHFLRPNRAAVSLRFDQVVLWEPLAPPTAPLPVEEIPRP